MNATSALSAIAPATLPDWLAEQAVRRPHAIALRQKRLGLWQVLSWREVATSVEQLAAGLMQRGFAAGDALLLVSQPRVEALLLSLAAQWAGGVAIPLDPELDADTLAHALTYLTPRFAFAEDDVQIERLLAHSQQVIDANLRDLPSHQNPAVTDYRTLIASPHSRVTSIAKPGDDAFVFLRVDSDGQLIQQRATHATLVREALYLATAEQLHAEDEALAARAFAATAQARYLIAPWLSTGFRLNFPESIATRDNDRRELAPTLVAGTQQTYARVARLIEDRLPGEHSWRRRLLQRAINGAGGSLSRTLIWWIIARPLREIIGFSRTHAALVAGPGLDEKTAALFDALRVDVHAWPDAGHWQNVSRQTESAPQAFTQRHGPLAQPA